MSTINTYKDVLVAVPHAQLAKLQELAVEAEINIKVVDRTNADDAEELLIEIQQWNNSGFSEGDWDNSGCEY